MKKTIRTTALISATILVLAGVGLGQDFANWPASAGILPFQTQEVHEYDSINLADLGVSLSVPVVRKGNNVFTYDLQQQTQIQRRYVSTTPVWFLPVNSLATSRIDSGEPGLSVATQFGYSFRWVGYCGNTATTMAYGWSLQDGYGTHYFPFNFELNVGGGGSCNTSFTATTIDNSGYTAALSWVPGTALHFSLYDKFGALDSTETAGAGCIYDKTTHITTCTHIIVDTNGNKRTLVQIEPPGVTATSPIVDAFTDETGATSVTSSYYEATNTPLASTVHTFPTATGSASIYVNKIAYINSVGFGCPSVNDLIGNSQYVTPQSSVPLTLPSSVSFPNGTQLTIGYEQTPNNVSHVTGRLGSLTLPTGGQITYTYSGPNHGINCYDGTTSKVMRTSPDGTFTYTHTPPSAMKMQIEYVTVKNNVLTVLTSCTPADYQQYVVGQAITFAGLAYATFLNGATVTITSVQNSNCSSQPSFTATFMHPDYAQFPEITGQGFGYNGALTSTTTVTDPQNNKSVYSFSGNYVTQRQVSASNGTLMQTNVICYNGNATNCAAGVVFPPITQRDVYTYIPGVAQPSLVEAKYDTYGNVVETSRYDFGGSGNNFINRTDIVYGSWTGSSCVPIGSFITGRPCSTTVTDASGNVMAQTLNTYDAKGNIITDKRLVSGNTYISRSFTYDPNGAVKTSTDWNGNLTTYSNTFCNNLFPSSVTAGGLTSFLTWDCNGAVMLTSTDPNNQKTTNKYNDPLWRPTEVDYPDGGQTTNTYSDTASPPNVVKTELIASGVTLTTQTNLDGLGRANRHILSSDPEGPVYTDTTYDAHGRVYQVSNPYRTTTDPTYGLTTTNYDALGRVTTLTAPDNGKTLTNYSANCATATDQAGRAKKSCLDGLGRLTAVWEDPLGMNFETDYQYNALGNLVCVHQKGADTTTDKACSDPTVPASWRPRRFVYDLFSRLTTTTNPESGTIAYTYDANSNLRTKTAPSPNQPSSGTATVTTNYTYDALNRLTSKSYDDTYASNPATSGVTYGYDGINLSCPTPVGFAGSNATNGLGRRTAMCFGVGSKSWAHDSMGRISSENDRFIGLVPPYGPDVITTLGNNLPTISTDTNYSYYLNGDLLEYLYPGPGIPNHEFYTGEGAAGRVTASGDDYYHMLTNATYTPDGQLATAVVGSSGSYNGNTMSNTYNNRLQPVLLSAKNAASAPILNLTYNFNLGSGDNGNVVQIANGKDNNRTQNFTYDSLNRISTAYTSGPNWGENYSIDAWGNLYGRAGVTGKNYYESLSCSANTNNQLNTCFTYDAAGNLITNGTTTYKYDAENRLISTSGYSYLYDGDGQRIEKCTAGATPGTCASNAPGTFYWKQSNGTIIAESDLGGNWTACYGVIRGRIASRVDLPSNTVHYYFQDHLGSTSEVVNASGNIQKESDYYPYGGEIPIVSGDANRYKFTGKERDSESNLDYFGSRYYASSMGRFMTPDPRYFQAVMMIDPQQFNLFEYGRNNPVKWVDPFGENLFLNGDFGWLLENVLYPLAGGQDAFNQSFHIQDGQVLLNNGVNPSSLNSGQQLILALVNSSDNFLYFAGTSGDAAAKLFRGTTKNNGKLNGNGKDVANQFTCGGNYVSGCGTVVGTSGRNDLQPANLANGDPVFAAIAYNEQATQTQTGVGKAGDAVSATVGQKVAPVSLFIHESAENLAFQSQGNCDYEKAHGDAISREFQIRKDLKISGGFAGGEIRSTVPKQ